MPKATFTDISEWQRNFHYSTGGTRSKMIVIKPDTYDEYFFKGSKETPNGEIRYPTEFWSEIVSSKIGQALGFPMLDYNIAYDERHKQKIGCLSKSMILSSENKLTEGINYLTGYNPSYNPETDKSKYNFQFIKSALQSFSLEQYLKNIIEIIVFDSIVGNSDRHQENWGIISFYKELIDKVEEKLKSDKNIFSSKIKNIFRPKLKDLIIDPIKMNPSVPHEFAPIYDSGCCLGREYLDDKIEKMLQNLSMVEAYIQKGKSEIHWENDNNKKNHFELVRLLLEDYPEETKYYIKRIAEKFNTDSIHEIIYKIDINLPENLINYKLSNSRKELMYKLVTLRIQKLISFL